MFTLVHALQRTARHHRDRPAILGDNTLTWGEWVDRIARAASVLRQRGVGRNDRFALMGRNSHAQAEMVHAGYWSGAIPVPVNRRLAPPEIAHVLRDSGASLVLVEEGLEELFSTDVLTPWADAIVPLGEGEGATLGLTDRADPVGPADVDADDIALLVYTGGTTGRGKGVPLKHRHIVANALQMIAATGIGPNDRHLHVAPMFHSADLLATAHTVQGGAHAYLGEPSPRAVLDAVDRHQVTTTMLPPVLVRGMVAGATDEDDLRSLSWLIYGSSPMEVGVVRAVNQRWPGLALYQGYGLTETSPILSLLSPGDHLVGLSDRPALLSSSGRAVAGVDLRIADASGRELAREACGEVLARGANVVDGYWRDPDADAAAFVDGWLRTGDVGFLDEAGYLTLLDRVKDMIITGGENVYSAEVEAVVATHPRVADAAVIGVPDEHWGEAVLAVIVPRGRPPSVEELIDHCRPHLAGYKIPRRLWITEELPRSAIGKVLKRDIRRLVTSED